VYVHRVRERAGRRGVAPRTAARAALAAAVALGLGACGKETSPDIEEASGSFPMEVVSATFPERQRVSLTSDLELTLRNTGDRAVPQLAVTIWTGEAALDEPKPQGSFAVLPPGAGAGVPSRSVWVLTPGFPKVLAAGDSAGGLEGAQQGGTEAAQTDTYTFGRLEPGATRRIVWRVTAVRAGRHDVNYAVAAGVGGPAKVVDDAGAVLSGTLPSRIEATPTGCVVQADGSSSGDCRD